MCCEGTWFLVGLRLNNKYLGKIKRILRCAPILRPQDFPGVLTRQPKYLYLPSYLVPQQKDTFGEALASCG